MPSPNHIFCFNVMDIVNLICRQSLSALVQKINNNNPLLGWGEEADLCDIFRIEVDIEIDIGKMAKISISYRYRFETEASRILILILNSKQRPPEY